MPSSLLSTTSNDDCEHCHSGFTLIKRKKNCAVCRQCYCGNCAPRKYYQNQPYRICLICQLISNDSTTDDQLLELKVKQLRWYLQAKNISHHTCTEKQELVDLIKRNRELPFTGLFSQQTQTSSVEDNTNQQQSQTTSNPSSASTTMQPPSKPNNSSGPFTNFQHSVSSFANQMNNFASNIQDYVSNTVSGAVNQAFNDQQPPTTTNNPNNGASFNFGTTVNGTGGPFNYTFSSPGNSAHTTTTTTNTTTNNTTSNQQQRRPPPSGAGAAAATVSSTSTKNDRTRRKSLSEINHEEKIEDLNIRELKEILLANFVDFKGCVEKSELIDKVRRLYRDRQNEQIKAKELGDSAAGDNELCKVCMDAIADCVFLDCGHMVTCVKCGKLLAECPICRSNIVRVVRVFKS